MVSGQISFRNNSAIMDWVEMGMTCPRNISCLIEGRSYSTVYLSATRFSLGIAANLIAQQKAVQFALRK